MLTLSVAVLPEVVDEEHSGVNFLNCNLWIYDNSYQQIRDNSLAAIPWPFPLLPHLLAPFLQVSSKTISSITPRF